MKKIVWIFLGSLAVFSAFWVSRIVLYVVTNKEVITYIETEKRKAVAEDRVNRRCASEPQR